MAVFTISSLTKFTSFDAAYFCAQDGRKSWQTGMNWDEKPLELLPFCMVAGIAKENLILWCLHNRYQSMYSYGAMKSIRFWPCKDAKSWSAGTWFETSNRDCKILVACNCSRCSASCVVEVKYVVLRVASKPPKCSAIRCSLAEHPSKWQLLASNALWVSTSLER